MKRKWKKWLLILFIGINCILVWVDNGQKVTRQAFVSSWERVYQDDLFETIEADGVISYSGESPVYYDKNVGSFDKFLVEEGSIVTVGDPLFQYRVNDFAEMETYLNYELEKVEGEIDAIETAISEMVAYRIPSPSIPVVDNSEEDTTVVVATQEPVEAELMKEQFVIEKEQELKAKQRQESVIKDQLKDLQETGDTITVTSPFEGKVKEISTTLNDPIIQIENMELLVKGELTESAREQVELEQSVEVSLKKGDEKLYGFIQHVEDTPYEVDVDIPSTYPFRVSFNEEQQLDAILPGYHVDLMITVNETLDAVVTNSEIVNNNHVWKLNELGKLDYLPVQTGLQVDDKVEISAGLSVGDLVTDAPISKSLKGMPFITPVKFSDVAWLDIGKYRDKLLYMTIGILER